MSAILQKAKRLFTSPLRAIKTYIRNFATFRYGQSYTHEEATNAMYRVPLLNFMAVILPEKAMKEGFDIVDDKKERQDDISNAWEKEHFLPDIIRGVQYDAGHGSVTFAFFIGRESEDALELLAFEPDDVDLDVDENGKIIAFELLEQIGCVKRPEILHEIPIKMIDPDDPEEKRIVDPNVLDGEGVVMSPEEQLKNVQHLVLRPSKIRFKGIPKIEKLWDVSHSHNIVLESAMVNTVRNAYGLKRATIHDRGSGPKTAAVERKIKAGLKSLDSGDTTMTLYSGFDASGKQWEDKVTIDSGGQGTFNYAEKLDLYHKVASFLIGIPKNYLDGIFAGETLAGDIIYRMIQSLLREIRDEWTEYLIPLIERWCELRGHKWNPTYAIEWRMPIAKLTEKEEAEIDEILARTQAGLLSSGLTDTPEARKKLGLLPHDKTIVKPASVIVEGLDSTTPPPEIPTVENKDETGVTAP